MEHRIVRETLNHCQTVSTRALAPLTLICGLLVERRSGLLISIQNAQVAFFPWPVREPGLGGRQGPQHRSFNDDTTHICKSLATVN